MGELWLNSLSAWAGSISSPALRPNEIPLPIRTISSRRSLTATNALLFKMFKIRIYTPPLIGKKIKT